MRPLAPAERPPAPALPLLALAARSSLRIEFTRISQRVFSSGCFLPTLAGWYLRLRSSPSIWT